MRKLDLRGRVTLASVVALTAGLVALAVATNLVLRSTLSSDASSVLRDRAAARALASVSHTVERDVGGSVRLRAALLTRPSSRRATRPV